jgi:hypothetical protein
MVLEFKPEWSVERAIDEIIQESNSLFDHYKDQEDEIQFNGIERLCSHSI